MASAKAVQVVEWELVTPGGPALAYHAGCVIGDTFYIHGGVDKKGSTSPLNKLYRMDLEELSWQEVREPNSPSLSHHVCLPIEDRYLLLIGGWSGKARVGDIHIFDTVDRQWTMPQVSGFPVGAGLSSHTATRLFNGDIIVLGREGSLRTQRRTGNAFLLSGDIQKGVFQWRDCPMGLDSRSGHSAHVIGSDLYIIGGRSDELVAGHRGYKSRENDGSPKVTLMDKIAKKIKDLTPSAKPPCGRKHFAAVSGAGSVFLHGGETFDGRSREPVGEMYLMSVKPHIQWYKLGTSRINRAGHVYCGKGDKLIIHGGEGSRGIIHADTYRLTA